MIDHQVDVAAPHTAASTEVVQREFAQRGYQLMLSVTAGDPVQERSSLRTLVDHSAAGVIVVGSDSEATGELRAITSLWPARSTASTSPADQSEKYSRSPCQRGDSTGAFISQGA